MPDTDTDTEPDMGEGTGGDAGAEGTEEQEVDYKAEAAKWKAMSQKHEVQAKQNLAAAKKVRDLENASKTELQRATETSTAAQKRADEAEAKALRYEVALEKEVPPKLMKFLTGTTREEIEASADELLEAIGGGKSGTGSTSSDKPKEKLRPGAASEGTEEEKPLSDVLAAIPRS